MHRSSKQFSRGLRPETTARCRAVTEDLQDRYLNQRLRRRSRRSATVSPTFAFSASVEVKKVYFLLFLKHKHKINQPKVIVI